MGRQLGWGEPEDLPDHNKTFLLSGEGQEM
jgi:hypothetical protein